MKKNLDCVEMKRRIQKEIMAERAAMTPEEFSKRQHQRIMEDERLGRILKLTKESTPAAPQEASSSD